MTETINETKWVPLTPPERRVLGVLVEKAKTTPEYYPLTIAAIVTGCNQKSNRDPVTNYDADDVDDILQGLRKKGASVMIEGGGRVVRWKHTLYDWFKVSKVELAVMSELMLRGPQTEGDLRARASRMEPLADLTALQVILEALASRKLVMYLTPPGMKRGAIVTHGVYPPDEAEKVRKAYAGHTFAEDAEEPGPVRVAGLRQAHSASLAEPAWTAEIDTLKSEIAGLKTSFAAMAEELRALKNELGV